MNKPRVSRILTWTGAVLLLVTASLHSSAIGQINILAFEAQGDVATLLPMLWWSFGVTLAITAGFVGILARRNVAGDQWLLVVTALVPLSGAGLQIVYVGFLAPTAVLILDGVVILAAAGIRRGEDTT